MQIDANDYANEAEREEKGTAHLLSHSRSGQGKDFSWAAVFKNLTFKPLSEATCQRPWGGKLDR